VLHSIAATSSLARGHVVVGEASEHCTCRSGAFGLGDLEEVHCLPTAKLNDDALGKRFADIEEERRPGLQMESLGPLMKELVHDDVRLVIAGRGDPALEDLARRLAEEDSRVHVEIGHVTLERKRQLFAESALVLMPYSAFESQSGVLHDAYGHARPVVVTEVGALGETVRADATGVVVSKRSPQKLAQAVHEVLSSGQWEQFSQAAQAIATKRSPAATGARLREVYDSVLQ
jgi:glycosyltransferase involved in cell wall biosynthesis